MASPQKLSHLVLKTYNVKQLRKYYCELLEAHVVFEQLPGASFITYDEEHHRLGFTMIPSEPTAPNGKVPGLAHLAFTFPTIRALLQQYEVLRDKNLRPTIVVHHGPTVSFYYQDPDKNNIEFFCDALSLEDAMHFMTTPVFQKNYTGIELDPEALLTRMKAGASDAELMHYDSEADIDVPALMMKQMKLMNFG